MVARIPGLDAVALIVRLHHERPDGLGYPHGVTRERIPMATRIVSVCDAYGAMTKRRPYSEPLDLDAALAELERHAGTSSTARSSARWSHSSGRTSGCPPEAGAAAARRQPLTTPVFPKTGMVPPASFTMFRQSRSTTSGLSPATSFSSSGSASVSNRRRSLPWLSAIRR
jgi:hypothetical protein